MLDRKELRCPKIFAIRRIESTLCKIILIENSLKFHVEEDWALFKTLRGPSGSSAGLRDIWASLYTEATQPHWWSNWIEKGSLQDLPMDQRSHPEIHLESKKWMGSDSCEYHESKSENSLEARCKDERSRNPMGSCHVRRCRHHQGWFNWFESQVQRVL